MIRVSGTINTAESEHKQKNLTQRRVKFRDQSNRKHVINSQIANSLRGWDARLTQCPPLEEFERPDSSWIVVFTHSSP